MNKKKTNLMQIMSMIIFTSIGGFIGLYSGKIIIKILEKDIPKPFAILILIGLFVFLFISVWLSTIIHEGGHFVFGLLTGYKFISFRIGSITFTKHDEKLTCKRYSLAGTGGQCIMSPPEFVNNKIPYILYNLGGIIFNLITGIISIVMFFLFYGNHFVSIPLLIFAVCNLGFFLINGIPLKGTVNNDGSNTIQISKSQSEMRSFRNQLKIAEYTANNYRLKDMPDNLFEYEDNNNEVMNISIKANYCNRLIDQHRFNDALVMIDSLTSEETNLMPVLEFMLLCEKVYCMSISCTLKNQIDEIYNEKQFKQYLKAMKNSPSVMRCNYTYAHLVADDQKTAEKILNDFSKISRSHPFIAEIETETELIELAKSQSPNINADNIIKN